MSGPGHSAGDRDGASARSGHPRAGADPFARTDPPLLALTLWPNRSLSRKGFVRFLAFFAACLALPLLPLVGTKVLWGLLPFLLAMLLAVYLAFRRNYADGRLVEELRLWPDLITVVRREPRGAVRRWHANPAWVSLRLLDDARIEKYLTLRGNGREIELGAFLAPEERESLYRELREALGTVRMAPGAH